ASNDQDATGGSAMAGIFRGQGGRIAGLLALLLALSLVASPVAHAQLYEQPTLIIDPGMHTAHFRTTGMDAAGRLAATRSEDKTVRVGSLSDGKLLQTIRIPAGSGNIGKVNAVAMSFDGALVAAGGWTGADGAIYVFEVRTGKMLKRISSSRAVADSLAFSPD